MKLNKIIFIRGSLAYAQYRDNQDYMSDRLGANTSIYLVKQQDNLILVERLWGDAVNDSNILCSDETARNAYFIYSEFDKNSPEIIALTEVINQRNDAFKEIHFILASDTDNHSIKELRGKINAVMASVAS